MRLITTLAGCVVLHLALMPGRGVAQSSPGTPLASLPSTFSGILPCADCPGIRYHLNLFPDGVFYLRMTYQERNVTSDDIGRWVVSSDRKILMLKGARETPVMFALSDRDTLRLLDMQGDAITSNLNYDLKRSPTVEALEPQGAVAGMYRYLADAGSFIECLTGRRMNVAQEGANAALESAYSAARRPDGDQMKAFVEGRISVRPNPDTKTDQPMLLVDRFIRVAPDEMCGQLFAALSLEKTDWRAAQLAGKATGGTAGREPQLTLDESGRVAGFDGCNRVAGSYTANGDAMAFGQLAGTRMACPGTGEIERVFRDALRDAKRWRVTGNLLDLFDGSGKRLARFRAQVPN